MIASKPLAEGDMYRLSPALPGGYRTWRDDEIDAFRDDHPGRGLPCQSWQEPKSGSLETLRFAVESTKSSTALTAVRPAARRIRTTGTESEAAKRSTRNA